MNPKSVVERNIMKLHLLQKLCSLIACVYLASSGHCQEKDKEKPLTGQQKADLERALTLSKQVNNLYSQGKYAEATPLALEALKIRRETLGNKHPSTATSINNLALLYSDQAQYAKAESLFIESLKISREVSGNKHPSTALSINNLAGLYSDQAQYAKAEPLYLEALKIKSEA